ncbi:MAG: eukaryotic-like serine/threonine-protein kinase [Phycisphaerales bacterium]|jgi:serine/threonine protein kinase/Flp pilus assembly protein TadD|nr:eukaryotic-like serine/threonine-protein kinase [Phycisphaerales bacterium]
MTAVMTTDPTKTDLAKVQELFEAARSRPAAERPQFLAEACGPDTQLRAAVESLLSAHDSAGDFLKSAAPGVDLDPPLMFTAPGTVIGHYKLLEPIGEGGYGTVFMAEQTTPVHRKVALKIIKAGMDTRQVIARFEAERQALALMDHPNIAKVFDAGTTDSGRPYFVMELVKGIPITKYCDEHRLEPRQRLELFMQVCHAVQHAHQKGIIHRDIKPTNVLVAQYDGKPVPKVIDFGVAKATGQQLTERTMFTGFGDVIGTPQYMSPEQAELNQLDIDTRSDIYSLGVLLYELLTGTTPLEAKRVKEAALLEVLRVIREEEPPRPSTRLTATAELPSIAAQRGLEPKSLSGIVRGELDWIVMKALEKDRARRYETANGLARDIERYMSDEPVAACPPSTTYRVKKFVRRNKGPAVAAAIVLLTLLGGIIGTSYGLIRAQQARRAEAARAESERRAREEAEAQRKRSDRNFERARVAIRRISLVARGSGDWAQLSPALRKKFTEQTMQFYESLLEEGSSEPTVRFETAVGYWSLAMNLGAAEDERAQKLARQAIAMLEALANESPNFAEYRAQLAWANFVLATKLVAAHQPAEAEAALRVSLKLYERLLIEAPRGEDPVDLVMVYLTLGELALQDGRVEEAENAFRRSMAMHELQATKYSGVDGNPHLYAISCSRLFKILVDKGQRREAVEMIRSRLELYPSGHGYHRWNDAAVMFMWIGDVENYRWACRELLNRFTSDAAESPEAADRIAKSCCLAPDSVTDFSRVERLAIRAVTDTERHVYRRYFNLSKGLTEYRAGRHEQAIEWLQRWARANTGAAFDGTAFATLAMAHHRLGHVDQARAALEAARAVIAMKPHDALKSWSMDWLHCEILLREAEALLGVNHSQAPSSLPSAPLTTLPATAPASPPARASPP